MITVIDSLDNAPLTKTHRLDSRGKLVSDSAPQAPSYLAFKAPVANIHDFKEMLTIIERPRALILGTSTTLVDDSYILVSKDKFAQLTSQTGKQSFAGEHYRHESGRTVITREKGNFAASPIMVFDVDPKDSAPEHCRIQSPEQLFEILSALCPPLGAVTRVQTYSASAGLIGPDGRLLKDGCSFHSYIHVSDPSRIAELTRILEIKLWAHGYGYPITSKDGKRLPRTLIDLAVYAQPNRIVYEAPPILRDGIRQERSAPQLVQGEVDILDLSSLPELTDEELQRYEELTRQRVTRKGLKSGHKARRLSETLAWDTAVRLNNGQVLTVAEFQASELTKVPCHCPIHDDRSPSAFIARNGAGEPFIYCSSCHGSYYVEGSFASEPDTGRHRLHRLNARYLSDIPMESGVVVLKSPAGTGKTTLEQRLIDQAGPAISIIYPTHRIALASAASSTLDLAHYQLLEGEDFASQKQLAICVNSLHKLPDPLPQYDIVILDEAEQVLRQFTDAKMKHKRLNLDVFKAIIRNARLVVASDADISLITIRFLEKLRPNDTFDIYINDYQPCAGRTLNFYDTAGEIHTRIHEALAAERKVYVASNGKIEANALFLRLQQAYPDRKGMVVTSDNSSDPAVRALLANINQHIQDYDYFISSPAVETGVSIDVAHFDIVFGLFPHPQVNTHLDILQALRRVRQVPEYHVHICLQRMAWTHPKARLQTRLQMLKEYEGMLGIDPYGYRCFADPLYEQLLIDVGYLEALAHSNLRERFVERAKLDGFTCQFIPAHQECIDQGKQLRKEGRALEVEHHINLLLATASLMPWEYAELDTKPIRTAEESVQLERHRIEQSYLQAVDRPLLARDRRGKRRERIRSFELGTLPVAILKELDHDELTNTNKSRAHVLLYTETGRIVRRLMEGIGFCFDHSGMSHDHRRWDATTLQQNGTVDFVRANAAAIQALPLLGLRLPHDFEARPLSYIHRLLTKFGVKPRLTTLNGEKVYRLDDQDFQELLAIVDRRKVAALDDQAQEAFNVWARVWRVLHKNGSLLQDDGTPTLYPELAWLQPSGGDSSLETVLRKHASPEELEAYRRAARGPVTLPLYVRYLTDPAEATHAVAQLLAAEGVLGLDIETAKLAPYQDHPKAGLDPHLSRIRLVQVYDGNDTVYVFDLFALDIEVLAPLWDKTLVAHNAVFELKHLMHAGVTPKQVECSLLQANALNGQRPSLAKLTQRLLGLKIDKTWQASDWGALELSPAQLEYAALDAVLPRELFTLQHDDLRALDLERTYTLMRDAQWAVAQKELHGIGFDGEGHQGLIRQWEAEAKVHKAELQQLMGPAVKLTSNTQLARWLEMNIDPQTLADWPRTPTGQLQTNANTLKLYPHLPTLKPLLAFKEVSKKLNTYGERYAKHINPVTGRIHSSFILGGTISGRLACRKPNIQNPLRDPAFRALFKAPEGRSLVVADFGQIELRVAAIISGDPNMLSAYANGEDLHRKTAAAVLRIDPDQVTREQRQIAKAVNFGLQYGGGAKGLARYAKTAYGVAMSIEEATQAREAFFTAYPGLAQWQKDTGGKAKLTHKVTTPCGRIRDFSKEKTGYRFTESLNTPIQGGAAEVLMATLACLRHHLQGLDAKLVNTVHDELVLEVAVTDVDKTKVALEAAMLEGFLAILPNQDAMTRDLVEAKDGPTWATAK